MNIKTKNQGLLKYAHTVEYCCDTMELNAHIQAGMTVKVIANGEHVTSCPYCGARVQVEESCE